MATNSGRSGSSVGESRNVSESRSVDGDATATRTAGSVNTDVDTASQTNEYRQAPHFRVPRPELPDDHPQVIGAKAPPPHGDALKPARTQERKGRKS